MFKGNNTTFMDNNLFIIQIKNSMLTIYMRLYIYMSV